MANIKDSHCDVKGVGDDEHRHPSLEEPLEEHKRVHIMQTVLIRYHSDKFCHENVGNDKPRNRKHDRLGKRLYHGEDIRIPGRRLSRG